MNYIDHSKQRTRKDELMNKETPLIDYAPHRRTDEVGERQDGAGAIGWLAVAVVCWIVVIVMAAKAGYFA
jgi:hypothetical protein